MNIYRLFRKRKAGPVSTTSGCGTVHVHQKLTLTQDEIKYIADGVHAELLRRKQRNGGATGIR